MQVPEQTFLLSAMQTTSTLQLTQHGTRTLKLSVPQLAKNMALVSVSPLSRILEVIPKHSPTLVPHSLPTSHFWAQVTQLQRRLLRIHQWFADAAVINLTSGTATTNADVAGLGVAGIEIRIINATTGTFTGTESDFLSHLG